MAHYSSNFYGTGTGEYYQTPYYTTSYDIVPFEDSVSYPGSYEFSKPKLLEYYSSPAYYSDAYEAFPTQSEILYSAYTGTAPRLIEYNPDTRFFSSDTQYIVSYSATTGTVESTDDTDFEDYDPTPYCGGYDPTLTYGKPLPASEEICYPRSQPESNDTSSHDFSYGSIPSPYGEDKIEKFAGKPAINGTEPTESGEHSEPEAPPLESGRGEQEEGYYYGCDDRYNPNWSGFDHDVSRCEYDDAQVSQTPYGYGLEAMDLCESLFGYSPCLSRRNYGKDNYGLQQCAGEEWQDNQWKGAADYLFGSPFAHSGGEAAKYRDPPTYNYERHYQEH